MNENFKTLLGKSGIKKRFLDADLSQFLFLKCNIPDIGSEQGIFIHGPRGVGKTHLLAAICKQKIADHLKCHGDIEPKDLPAFIPVPELLFLFKKSYSEKSNITADEILKKYTQVRVLLLDDMGAERSTDWAVEMLYLLINRRSDDMKQTFISSNLDISEIQKHLDDRIASRIIGMCDVVKLSGQDRRIRRVS